MKQILTLVTMFLLLSSCKNKEEKTMIAFALNDEKSVKARISQIVLIKK